jgi:hypothetical protein
MIPMIAHITRRILNIWCGNDAFFFGIELRTVLSQEWTNTSVGNGLQNYGFFKKHIKKVVSNKKCCMLQPWVGHFLLEVLRP